MTFGDGLVIGLGVGAVGGFCLMLHIAWLYTSDLQKTLEEVRRNWLDAEKRATSAKEARRG